MTENLFFFSFFGLFFSIHFCVCISLFLVADDAITLFNSFFRDFRGFRGFLDFQVFDLAKKLAG